MEEQKEYLPVRIMKMVKELHKRGYNHLYLFSGMAPSGMSWRYMIGLTSENQWPAESYLVRQSAGPEGRVDWAEDSSTVELLADGFEKKFADQLEGTKSSPTQYSTWYDDLIDSLPPNTLLYFYADGPSEFDYLLSEAPGIDMKMYSKYS